MDAVLQHSLFDTGDAIELGPLAPARTHLARGAWVDYQPSWLTGADLLFDALHHDVPWKAERREMYERVVDVPRLLKFYEEGEPLPHPALAQALAGLLEARLAESAVEQRLAGTDVGRKLFADHEHGRALPMRGASSRMRQSRDPGSSTMRWNQIPALRPG